MIDRDGGAVAARVSGAAGAAASARRRVRLGRARWSDRLSVLRMAAPLRTGAAAGSAASSDGCAASPGETVENWLVRNGQTARLREMLWDPLALAALNQPPAVAAAPPFARVLGGDVRRAIRERAAIVLPTRPLRRDVRRAGARVHRGVAAARCGPARRRPCASRTAASPASSAAAERWTSRARSIAAVPWFALARALRGRRRAARAAARAARRAMARRRSSPSTSGSIGRCSTSRSSACRAARCSGCSTSGRCSATAALAPVAGVERRGRRSCAWTNEDARSRWRIGELADALAACRAARARAARPSSASRARRSRSRPASRRGPATTTPVRGLFLAGDWIDTGLPATIESAVRSGHRRRRGATARFAMTQ